MREVYIDWVQFNYGKHLSGWIKNYQAWQAGWRTLGVMSARWYDAPIGRVRCRFVQVLAAELTGVWQRFWNAERFIVFQTMILQRARHVTKSCEIQQRIDWRLDAWEAG